ncbi:hypothetical protein ACFQ3P_03440 [Paraburkholderia sabiae]|uniref:Heat induced stress protein YflT n=1 Tax=Paraburkholderia sabiae TaxID=273251 RepID=A0ABU9Q738_9BURK|nr:hypothetical protein [Paraburkholderia sabiae]WJZ78921.1 hypothetical protein QEN71_33650 [Paraburkholderia sabiae]CAD6513423.1 hypothetical protein LMG24235_00690 [Paraburkholderia sabiae]
MRQTVMGVYDSHADARAAQQSLNAAGVAQADIAIYSLSVEAPVEKGPRVYAPGGAAVGQHTPVFDRLEQLFARLFKSGEYPPEAEDYREFVRRGGTILSADVSEMQVDMARDVMRRAGAADIEERTAAWRNGSGISADRAGSTSQQVPLMVDEYEVDADDTSMPGDAMEPVPVDDSAQKQTAFTASQPNMVSGMQQVTTRTEGTGYGSSAGQRQQQSMSAVPDVGIARSTAGVTDDMKSRNARPSDSNEAREAIAAAEPTPRTGLVGDPIMGTPLEEFPYDDEFRKDYDARYANTGSSYDEYRRAYTHGTTLGQDERYREQDWQSVEQSARENWESRYPESGWERFKAAVRHGWERVRSL